MKKLQKESMILTRQKHKPGSAVQRFGDWRKGEPQIIIDNQTWLEMGKPDKVEFTIPSGISGRKIVDEFKEDLKILSKND